MKEIQIPLLLPFWMKRRQRQNHDRNRGHITIAILRIPRSQRGHALFCQVRIPPVPHSPVQVVGMDMSPNRRTTIPHSIAIRGTTKVIEVTVNLVFKLLREEMKVTIVVTDLKKLRRILKQIWYQTKAKSIKQMYIN